MSSYSTQISTRDAFTADAGAAILWTIISVMWFTIGEMPVSTVCIGIASVFGFRWMDTMEAKIDG